jgi:hypothetical protein
MVAVVGMLFVHDQFPIFIKLIFEIFDSVFFIFEYPCVLLGKFFDSMFVAF